MVLVNESRADDRKLAKEPVEARRLGHQEQGDDQHHQDQRLLGKAAAVPLWNQRHQGREQSRGAREAGRILDDVAVSPIPIMVAERPRSGDREQPHDGSMPPERQRLGPYQLPPQLG